ncbi:18583cfa-7e5f-4830-b4d1-0df306cf5db3 [Sclerotinia trifoliorum]|uniref:Apurinic-apyrimidinic endonuclease 1 n=1 Tax=Sclerotinia trifoliorum TaxID=28548 RepID=A0A8H2VKS5_9HELO|nr:18583cfa-7e5f-4830-b4d1-0df306cf5db3 [Sclerotinia trifoliorum]
MPPRRSGRNANAKVADIPTVETADAAKRKRGKNIKTESTEVINKVEKSIPKKVAAKQTKREEYSGDETDISYEAPLDVVQLKVNGPTDKVKEEGVGENEGTAIELTTLNGISASGKDENEEEPIVLPNQATEGREAIVLKEEVVVVTKKKSSVKRKLKDEDEDEAVEEPTAGKKLTKKRKTKEEKEAEIMPLAQRTLVSTLKQAIHIGAHVSGAGGVHNSINNSLRIGGNAFALFLKSQKKWVNPPLAPEARDQFKAFCKEQKYDASKYVLPHCSYLVNLAQPDEQKAKQAYDCFLDDLKRCEDLGIKLYNFHPGSTGGHPRPEAIARIAAQLNKAHKATKTVVTLLENMAGAGNVIGSTWEDLRDIIALIDDKSRVGVCLDTCHTFAAGYDLRSPEAFKETMDGFSKIVGLPYLKALHLNDSKSPLASNRDLHANIGTGFLGLRAFHNVINFKAFQNMPMVLETPMEKKGANGKNVEDPSTWAAEIKLLEGLLERDPESKEFKEEEQRLQDLGADERKKYQDQVDKKKQEVLKKGQKTLDSMFKKTAAKKGKKGKKESDDEDSEGGCSH